ncbi:hypothetical protein QBC36DRAFT_89212 [Triangularia setosa]|uniref:Rhodopsin domain-containing protein n=1 Tax=Triangularia setosa TaxID=2587417 RepID=A0AAN6VYT2_9PEZI|nr:hypothetical protein QBC36DRAFT_89212 [Podospora setosa]
MDSLNPPALIPFEESDSAGNTTAVLVTSVVALGLALLSVVARIYIRVSFRQGVQIDDYMIFLSTVGLSICGGLLLWFYAVAAYGLWLADVPVEGQLGLSGHDLERITLYLKIVYAVAILYFAVSGTTKLGILLMYRRIFRRDSAFNIQLMVVGALASLWCLSGILASVFNCVPVEKAWALPINDERYCYNYNIFWLAAGILEVVFDVMILALPMTSLRKLKMPLANKLSAGGIFFLGGFVVVTGIVKVALGYVPGGRNPNQFKTVLWATLHLTTAVICATLPIMNPMLRRIRKSWLIQLVAGSVLSTNKSGSNNISSSGFSRVGDGDERNLRNHDGEGREDITAIPLNTLGSQSRLVHSSLDTRGGSRSWSGDGPDMGRQSGWGPNRTDRHIV